jgi:hypothetical protein
MSNGFAAASAIVISEEDVKKIIPNEFEKVTNALEMYQVTFAELAVAAEREEEIDEAEEGASEEILCAWKEAQEAFQDETNISLFIGFHNSDDEGDIYDGVSGVFFSLPMLEVLHYSPAAKELNKKDIYPEFTQWVVHG